MMPCVGIPSTLFPPCNAQAYGAPSMGSSPGSYYTPDLYHPSDPSPLGLIHEDSALRSLPPAQPSYGNLTSSVSLEALQPLVDMMANVQLNANLHMAAASSRQNAMAQQQALLAHLADPKLLQVGCSAAAWVCWSACRGPGVVRHCCNGFISHCLSAYRFAGLVVCRWRIACVRLFAAGVPSAAQGPFLRQHANAAQHQLSSRALP